ncbi:hypothetical protein HYV74_03865 [Candidatus Uhrbacteria bacterium]|nr:hypothetical protein [Candidatus Uhrbacteria bacterium]
MTEQKTATIEQARAVKDRIKSQYQQLSGGQGIAVERVGDDRWGVSVRFPSKAAAQAAALPEEIDGVPIRADIIPEPMRPRAGSNGSRVKKAADRR